MIKKFLVITAFLMILDSDSFAGDWLDNSNIGTSETTLCLHPHKTNSVHLHFGWFGNYGYKTMQLYSVQNTKIYAEEEI